MNRIQVLIVDDHPLFRRGVRWSLEAETDILVVGEAAMVRRPSSRPTSSCPTSS